MRRAVLAFLVIWSSSILAEEECPLPSNRVDCEAEVAAAGNKRAAIANDCAAAKALLQFCNRAGKSRRTRIYDLNESALAAIQDGRRDALVEAVQKLQRADGLVEKRDDLFCQAAIVNNLGMAHYFLGQQDDAIRDFTRAADYAAAARAVTPPVRPAEFTAFTPAAGTYTCFGQPIPASRILTNRGLAHLRAGHYREAEQDYDTVAADGASERELDLLDLLATAALDRKDYGEVARIAAKMRQASAAPARTRRAWTVEGIAAFRADRLADAAKAFEAAAAAGAPPDEKQGKVHLALAEIDMRLDPPRIDAAIEQFEKAARLIAVKEGRDRVALGHGAALIRRGVDGHNEADVQRGIQEVAAVDPDLAKGYWAYAESHAARYAYDHAVRPRAAANVVAEESWRVSVSQAASAFCEGRLNDAEKLYRQALAAEPDHLAQRGLADVLYARGRRADPLGFNADLAAADAQYASIQPINEAERKHIAAMRGHIAYIRHDWSTALAYYAKADDTDAGIRNLARYAAKAKEIGNMQIVAVRPDDRGPQCSW